MTARVANGSCSRGTAMDSIWKPGDWPSSAARRGVWSARSRASPASSAPAHQHAASTDRYTAGLPRRRQMATAHTAMAMPTTQRGGRSSDDPAAAPATRARDGSTPIGGTRPHLQHRGRKETRPCRGHAAARWKDLRAPTRWRAADSAARRVGRPMRFSGCSGARMLGCTPATCHLSLAGFPRCLGASAARGSEKRSGVRALQRFSLPSRIDGPPDCERRDGASLTDAAQGGDRRVGGRDPRGAHHDEYPGAASVRVVEPEGGRRCATEVKTL